MIELDSFTSCLWFLHLHGILITGNGKWTRRIPELNGEGRAVLPPADHRILGSTHAWI